MRTGLERWLAACAPLTLFALTACGSADESGPKSPADERTVSATSDSTADSSGRESEGPSRGSGSRGTDDVVGDSAGPGGQGPEGGSGAQWPADDVSGALPQAAPAAGGGRGDAVILTYDAGAAEGFAGAIRTAAESWNDRVPEVKLQRARAGTDADIRIVATKGWPGAEPQGPTLGKGTVSIGRRALAQGHDAIRIMSHEFGHMLGLEDKQPGSCSSVMSGKSPGTACTNSYPSPAEVREVRGKFGAGATARAR